MSYTGLLIQTCTIQEKTLSLSGYEQLPTWENVAENVPCRVSKKNSVSIQDAEYRLNIDDELVFFENDAPIARGNRIIISGENYDVLKVNEVYNSKEIHHLEVVARHTDHD